MKKIPLNDDMIVASALPIIDYSDCFSTMVDVARFPDIDAFVRSYFLSQPRWLSAISTNIFSKNKMLAALEGNAFTEGDRVGGWKVYTRDAQEIVFGEHMGFMEYRFGLRLDDDKLRVATTVQYKGRFGRYYFALVRLLHQKFVLRSLTYPQKEKKS